MVGWIAQFTFLSERKESKRGLRKVRAYLAFRRAHLAILAIYDNRKGMVQRFFACVWIETSTRTND